MTTQLNTFDQKLTESYNYIVRVIDCQKRVLHPADFYSAYKSVFKKEDQLTQLQFLQLLDRMIDHLFKLDGVA